MSIRLFRARRGAPRKRRKITSLAVVAAMVAGVISVVFFGMVQPASAAVDDYRPASWNMQGAQNGQDNKYQSGVRRLIELGHNVIALQEAGTPPASAGRLDPATDRIVPGEPAHTFAERTFSVTGTRANGTTYAVNQGPYVVQRYDWRPNGSRGGLYQIYFMQTDFGANRVNLAIITNDRAAGVNIAEPGLPGGRPALGVRLGSGSGSTYFWSIHAMSGHGNDGPRLLQNIARASGSRYWAAMGDYNRLPTAGPRPLNAALPAGMHIYRTGEATHYGGRADANGAVHNRELDYMVSNQVIPGYVPGTEELGSDHRAVYFYPLRAAAQVEIRLPSDDDSTAGVGGDTADKVVTWDFDTVFSWLIERVAGTVGWYTIKDASTGAGCWDAEQSKLSVKPCNGSSWQQFGLDAFNDTGQIKITMKTRVTCVGEDPDDRDLTAATSLVTTNNCNDGRSRLNLKWDHDPGADAVALPIFAHDELLQIPQATLTVAPDGSAQYRTVQDAINAVPADGYPHTILVSKGTYKEAITVPKTLTKLTIKGATGNAEDVNITEGHAHGMTNPATGALYGTEGSATASFKAPNLRVEGLTITNSFAPSAHPEIDQYSTQAVALAATGDRQVYTNVRIIGRQDTVLAKSPVATDQTRQYFRNVYIQGSIDFIFGNATAVFDRANIGLTAWPGGTIVAPNTDQAKKYGFLITNSNIFSSAAANTFYLGRPWHNTSTARPQTVIRDSTLPAAITTAQPWTNMDTTYTWQQARFFEYHNSGAGAGVNSNRPQLTAAQAGEYTAQNYLAGTDGWNPIW